jgi:hypothetical protein
MASMKLNNTMRESICRAVLNHRFAKEEEAMEKEGHKVANDLYNLLLTAKERKRMNSLPCGWLNESSRIDTQVPGYCWLTLKFGKDDLVKKRFPYMTGNDYKPAVGSEAAVIALGYMERREKLKEERKALDRTVNALLNSVTTVNKAIDIWPEAKTFIEKVANEYCGRYVATSGVPMIVPEKLNEQLNLPPKA